MELIKKNKKESKIRMYGFPVSEWMKSKLDEIKLAGEIDVNEMFRQFAGELIDEAAKKTFDELNRPA